MNNERIPVSFQGETIDCESRVDAAAFKLADDVLCGCTKADPSQVRQLATVIDRYNRPVAAERLRCTATRQAGSR
jgi:hypothetical protein